MKKDIIAVDELRGIFQVTTVDERWYARPVTNLETGLPESFEYVPSVTWITKHYPKGVGYMKWLAGLGWNEAEAVRQAGAEKGSKVHHAAARLLDGDTVTMSDLFSGSDGNDPSPLTVAEYAALLSLVDWYQSLEGKVEVIARDLVVWGNGYAGTLDLLIRIAGRVWLIDFKTSQDIWPEHELQVTAYCDALPIVSPIWNKTLDLSDEGIGLAILQLGYRRNARGWKFTEIEPQPALFAATRAIWAKETAGGEKPMQRDYPIRLALSIPLEPKPKKVRKHVA